MAISFVGSVTGTATSGSSITLDLTALTGGSSSSVSTGDVIFALVGWASVADESPAPTTSGYTLIAELYANDDRDANFSVYVKRAGGTPDTSLIVSSRASSSYGSVAAAYVVSGASGALWPVPTTATGTNAALPNSPSITTKFNNSWVFTFGLGTGDTTPADFTAPSGYGNSVVVKQAGSSSGAILVAASKLIATADAEDPGAWTGGESTTSDSWAAVTVALAPAGSIVSATEQASVAVATSYGTFVDQSSVAVATSYGTFIDQSSVAVAIGIANPAYVEQASIAVLMTPIILSLGLPMYLDGKQATGRYLNGKQASALYLNGVKLWP